MALYMKVRYTNVVPYFNNVVASITRLFLAITVWYFAISVWPCTSRTIVKVNHINVVHFCNNVVPCYKIVVSHSMALYIKDCSVKESHINMVP